MSFEAKFPGVCGACDEKIEPGDMVLYDAADTVVHEVCPVVAPEASKAACPSCWLVHAGECDR